MEGNLEKKTYLKWYQKIAYGSGDLAANCAYGLIGSFLMLYLTNIVGMNSGIVGTLMLVARLFDGSIGLTPKWEKQDLGCLELNLEFQFF